MIALLRIMYAPLDYVHLQRFSKPTEALSPSLQQAINHHLIEQFELATALDFSISAENFASRLIAEWHLVRHVARLLGAKLARGSLAVGGQLATLPEVARRFVALPLPCPSYPSDMVVSQTDMELLGAHYLSQLHSHLPVPLAQRLPLCFAPETDIIHSVKEIPLTLNLSLVTFAFDYAQNNSH